MGVRVPSSALYAKIAQLVERNLAKVEVAGSNPVFRSTRPGGGIGRHAGLKILCPQGRTGSSPVWGTLVAVNRKIFGDFCFYTCLHIIEKIILQFSNIFYFCHKLFIMEIFQVFASVDAWIALLTLTFLEIVLGIDNIVFISIVSNKIEPKDQRKARNIGLGLAMLFRILLLFGIKWVVSLNNELFGIHLPWFHGIVTGQSLIIFIGGLFLLYKSVSEIHHKLEGEEEFNIGNSKKTTLASAVAQIAALNLVFSFDSILTAVGLVSFEQYGDVGALSIMILAVVISVFIMMAFAGPVSNFVNRHPTIQILGLSFLILIGVMLLAEASHLGHFSLFGQEVGVIPKGYLYFAIFFSLLVEFINMKLRKNSKPVELHNSDKIDKF